MFEWTHFFHSSSPFLSAKARDLPFRFYHQAIAMTTSPRSSSWSLQSQAQQEQAGEGDKDSEADEELSRHHATESASSTGTFISSASTFRISAYLDPHMNTRRTLAAAEAPSLPSPTDSTELLRNSAFAWLERETERSDPLARVSEKLAQGKKQHSLLLSHSQKHQPLSHCLPALLLYSVQTP